MRPSRIWYLADARLPGPAANTVQMMKMCAALQSMGQDVTLLARLDLDTSVESLFRFYAVPPSFKIARAPRLIPGRSGRDQWNLPFTFSALPYLKMRAARFDFLYTRLPLLAALAAGIGLRVIYEAHRLLPAEGWMTRWATKRFLNSAGRRNFLALVGISDVLGQWYAQRGFPNDKILVAHDGVDLERFDPPVRKEDARRLLGLPQNKKIVCYCGHLYAGRGVEELLACAQALGDVLFLFAGGNAADVKKYEREAMTAGLTNTQFSGFVANGDIPRYLFAADVLAMPYTEQTGSAKFMSPMKMFEYLAARRPIVATKFPSVCEVLRDGHNAILVEPGSVAALRQGLETALNDGHSSALGEQAGRDVLSWTWRKRAERILAFVRQRESLSPD